MKVYIVRAFDGDYSSTRKVFASLDKAEIYVKESEKEDIAHYGYKIDNYYVDEYDVVE